MASARELIDLIRLLLDGDKIDVINYASIDNLLRKAGSSIDQVQMKEPFVAYRYDKQYRAQSLNQLYDKFSQSRRIASKPGSKRHSVLPRRSIVYG